MPAEELRPERLRKVRPAVVAGTVLAVVALVGVAPAAAYVRHETALGMRLLGDPGLRWVGESLPAAPATAVPRYRVVPAPAIRLSAAARRHLHLDQPLSHIDESGNHYTVPVRTLETRAESGATVVWSSYAAGAGRPVRSGDAIAAVRALFADDLGLRLGDWHFEIRPAGPGVHRSAARDRTFVAVDPMVQGRPLIQNHGYRLGGSVSVDSSGIRDIDLRLGRLVRDGSTLSESAAAAWDRAKHHRTAWDDEMSVPGGGVTFTEATPGLEFPPGRDGQPIVSVPTWTFSNHDGDFITVSADSLRRSQ
jgi:hypothetical protein